MGCKGICGRYKATRPRYELRYANQKRCTECEVFIKFEGMWCPCCGYRLRMKPRNNKAKARLREMSQILVTKTN